MREFLITKFICATCGSNLELTYDLPRKDADHAEGEPTGAAKVEQLVGVLPCKTCFQPLLDVKKALETLIVVGDMDARLLSARKIDSTFITNTTVR